MHNRTTSGRILMAVQGEGRGHMTQALALRNILAEAGYEIAGVTVGISPQRRIPDFFVSRIAAPLHTFQSPNFKTDSRKKAVRIGPSVVHTLLHLPRFTGELRRLHRLIKSEKPELILNFYEPLMGLYYLLYRPAIPMVCIAHQYVYHHPGFVFPEISAIQKFSLKTFTRLTAAGARLKLALSLYPIREAAPPDLAVLPPLLRQEVSELQPTAGDYILIYLLNAGYMEEIIAWHQKNPAVQLHCFTDRPDIQGEWKYDDTLSFHQLDDKKFLQYMAGCRAFAGTAGFESIAEAMFLGKPVFMVPVAGQFEQWCNARDAASAGAGIYGDTFDLDRLLQYQPQDKFDHTAYRQWVLQGKSKIIEHIARILPLPEYAQAAPGAEM